MALPAFDVFKDPELHLGLEIYCELAGRRIRELSARAEKLYGELPAFKPLRAGLTGEVLLKHNAEGIAQMAMANRTGEWVPYHATLVQRGVAYARAGIQLADWTDFLRQMLTFALDLVFEELGGDPARLKATSKAVTTLFYTLVQVVGQTFVDTHGQTIIAQQVALMELSTPVLVVGERVLLVPLIGALDASRMAQLQPTLLSTIRSQRAKAVVLDVTGVAHVDTAVAQRLGGCIKAARFMGARVLVSGLSSELSQAMVLLGVAIPGAETFTALDGALASVLGSGLAVAPARAN